MFTLVSLFRQYAALVVPWLTLLGAFVPMLALFVTVLAALPSLHTLLTGITSYVSGGGWGSWWGIVNSWVPVGPWIGAMSFTFSLRCTVMLVRWAKSLIPVIPTGS